jgi:hypothetical protein
MTEFMYPELRERVKILLKEELPSSSMYKIKDFIVDWYLKQNFNPEKFWEFMSENTNSMFLFLDDRNYFDIPYHCTQLNLITNVNSGIIGEITIEKIFDYIPNDISIWRVICEQGNKYTIRILENNIEKYRDKYGLYYKDLYISLCANPNAGDIIRKYYDEMFCERCLGNLCRNTNSEILCLIEPFIKKINEAMASGTDTGIIMTLAQPKLMQNLRLQFANSSLMRNPLAMPYIKQLTHIESDQLSMNPAAIDIIERYKIPDDVNMDRLSTNENAIHLLENNIHEINFKFLAKNENGIDLIEKHLELARMDDGLESSFIYDEDVRNIANCYIEEAGDPPWEPNTCVEDFCSSLCLNPKSIEFLQRHPQYLNEEILRNPNIFEINWKYLKSKFNYISNEEEKQITSYLNKEIEVLDPLIMKKLNNDYVTENEIQKIIDDYKNREEYLSENLLIIQLSKERLIKAVYKPSRVEYYLNVYNYDICRDCYCEDDE